jgi:hypothetical protein
MERVMDYEIPQFSGGYAAAEEADFFKIPTDETQLEPVAIFWDMDTICRADELIKSSDIRDDSLSLIYDELIIEARGKIQDDFIKKKWTNEF